MDLVEVASRCSIQACHGGPAIECPYHEYWRYTESRSGPHSPASILRAKRGKARDVVRATAAQGTAHSFTVTIMRFANALGGKGKGKGKAKKGLVDEREDKDEQASIGSEAERELRPALKSCASPKKRSLNVLNDIFGRKKRRKANNEASSSSCSGSRVSPTLDLKIETALEELENAIITEDNVPSCPPIVREHHGSFQSYRQENYNGESSGAMYASDVSSTVSCDDLQDELSDTSEEPSRTAFEEDRCQGIPPEMSGAVDEMLAPGEVVLGQWGPNSVQGGRRRESPVKAFFGRIARRLSGSPC
ncbi:hypothetical protein M501DRAFT_996641 [Patellaria atrata CBS 101060]|uniref:Uncharacterized protein n=1 Tax=Patellaria atrata CBS 101060 TaxID=1346257 RepID=A0A9P4S5E3_9PEZI|nr:hypothetical protein M501DRAFT_996641 [Patellaria atrata CBS 101060]